MPKKTDPPESQEAQSQRFLEAARAIEDDGGLSPTEAAEAFERLAGRVRTLRSPAKSSQARGARRPEAT